jgi:hypothetical protein
VLGPLEPVHLARNAVVHALELGAVADRPVHRHRADAQHLLDLREQLQRLAAGPVELVDEREDRDAALAADREQLAGLRLDAFGVVDQHHGAVGGHQGPVGVLGKVLVPGRVQQVEHVAVVLELQHGRGDRDPALPLQFHPV